MQKALVKLLLVYFCVFSLIGCGASSQPITTQELSTSFSCIPLEVIYMRKSGVPMERVKGINLILINPETGYKYRYTEVVEEEGKLPHLWELKKGAVVLAEIQLWKNYDTNELVEQRIYRILDKEKD